MPEASAAPPKVPIWRDPVWLLIAGALLSVGVMAVLAIRG